MRSSVLIFLLCTSIYAKNARTLRLNESATSPIYIGTEGTVINFPSKPNKVVLGQKGAFIIEYIEDDLAISALRPGALSNLFVYLNGKRFGFNLKAVAHGGDEIVMVRDRVEQKIKAKVRFE